VLSVGAVAMVVASVARASSILAMAEERNTCVIGRASIWPVVAGEIGMAGVVVFAQMTLDV
jgi:hypothetical protein